MKKLLHLALIGLMITFTPGYRLSAAEAPVATESLENSNLPPEFIEELRKAEEKGGSRFYDEFLNMLFYLGIILLFILILMWFLKRVTHVRIEQGNQTSAIKILEHRTLTPKTTIYLLEVFGKTVVIADSVNGITRLTESNVVQKNPDL